MWWRTMKRNYELYCKNGGDPFLCWGKNVYHYDKAHNAIQLYTWSSKFVVGFDMTPLKRMWFVEELTNFEDLLDAKNNSPPLTYEIMRDELSSYMDFRQPTNKREAEHSAAYWPRLKEALRHLTETYVAAEWKKFLQLPPTEQTMEEYGLLALQLTQDSITVPFHLFRTNYNVLADKVKLKLKESYPDHPIFSTPEENVEVWKKNIIVSDQWDDRDTARVVDAVCSILYEEAEENKDAELYRTPLRLAIMLEGTTKRLGVRCPEALNSYVTERRRRIVPTDYLQLWSNNFSIHVEELSRCKTAMLEEIQHVSIINGYEDKYQFLLEHINRIEIPCNMHDFLELAKLYIVLKMIRWSGKRYAPEMKSLELCDSITTEVHDWLCFWEWK
ncbi:uncharacterized protein [Prorops nasuta]|uniref:uncharacterized protein n=1 Tax=Prorops nasuta TaxID=863751 RepID=UPI0034CE3FEF